MIRGLDRSTAALSGRDGDAGGVRSGGVEGKYATVEIFLEQLIERAIQLRTASAGTQRLKSGPHL